MSEHTENSPQERSPRVSAWKFYGVSGVGAAAMAIIGAAAGPPVGGTELYVAMWVSGAVAFGLSWVDRHWGPGNAAAAAPADELELLRDRHQEVVVAWSAYELDLVEVFRRPALADVTVRETAALHDAMRAAEHALGLVESSPTEARVKRYEAAVAGLESAWRRADQHAERLRLSHLDHRQQQLVTRAQKALQRALTSPSPEESHASCRAALRLVEHVLVVPAPGRAALEAHIIRAIEAGAHTPAAG